MGARMTISEVVRALKTRSPTSADAHHVFRIKRAFRATLIIYGCICLLIAFLALTFGWITSTYLDPCTNPVDNVAFWSILYLVNVVLAFVLAFIDPMRNWKPFVGFIVVHLIWVVAQFVLSIIYLVFEGFSAPYDSFWITLDVLVVFMIVGDVVMFVVGIVYVLFALNLSKIPSYRRLEALYDAGDGGGETASDRSLDFDIPEMEGSGGGGIPMATSMSGKRGKRED